MRRANEVVIGTVAGLRAVKDLPQLVREQREVRAGQHQRVAIRIEQRGDLPPDRRGIRKTPGVYRHVSAKLKLGGSGADFLKY